jgi:hypothetical protein
MTKDIGIMLKLISKKELMLFLPMDYALNALKSFMEVKIGLKRKKHNNSFQADKNCVFAAEFKRSALTICHHT